MPQPVPASSQLIPYWNESATTKEFRHPIPDSIISNYFPSGAAIIDIGCGQGRLCKQLSDMGFSLSGTDTSAAMLEQAKKTAPNCEFRQSQDGKIPWNDDSFEVAIAVTLFISVPAETEQQQLISEVKRVLKPNGLLFISDMPLQWSTRYIERYQKGLQRYGQYGVFALPSGNVVRHHELSYFMQLVSGFNTLEIETHNVTTMNSNSAQAIRYIGRLPKHC